MSDHSRHSITKLPSCPRRVADRARNRTRSRPSTVLGWAPSRPRSRPRADYEREFAAIAADLGRPSGRSFVLPKGPTTADRRLSLDCVDRRLRTAVAHTRNVVQAAFSVLGGRTAMVDLWCARCRTAHSPARSVSAAYATACEGARAMAARSLLVAGESAASPSHWRRRATRVVHRRRRRTAYGEGTGVWTRTRCRTRSRVSDCRSGVTGRGIRRRHDDVVDGGLSCPPENGYRMSVRRGALARYQRECTACGDHRAPDLELVGVHVHSAGRSAAMPAVVRIASRRRRRDGRPYGDSHSDADCLSYMANGVGREPDAIADVVVSRTGHQRRHCPLHPFRLSASIAPPEMREAVSAACARAVIVLQQRIDPGFATRTDGGSLLALATEVESVRVQELGNFSRYGALRSCERSSCSANPPNFVPPCHEWDVDACGEARSRRSRDLLETRIDEIVLRHEVATVAPRCRVRLRSRRSGHDRAVRFELQGMAWRSTPRYVEHVDRIALRRRPPMDRATSTDGTAYRLVVTAAPSYTCELGFSLAGGVVARSLYGDVPRERESRRYAQRALVFSERGMYRVRRPTLGRLITNYVARPIYRLASWSGGGSSAGSDTLLRTPGPSRSRVTRVFPIHTTCCAASCCCVTSHSIS